MPTYEYRCKNCDHEFELFQSMSAPTKRKCPECKKNTLERLIGTGGAVIFKGGGFYETDYRSDAYKKAAKADKPETAKTSSDAGSSSGDKKKSDTPKSDAAKKPDKPGKSAQGKASSNKD